MIPRGLLRLTCIAALFIGLSFPAPPALAMSAADARLWREDLGFMAREMEKTHKDLFHSVSKERFAAMVGALDKKIPRLEPHEVIVEMMAIVASVGDGHTNIYPTRDPKIGFHELPISFTFFGDDLIVRAAAPAYKTLLGAKLVRIGDHDVADAIAAVTALVGSDNAYGGRYWVQYLLAMPEVLHALRLTPSPTDVPLTLETGTGRIEFLLHPFGPAPLMTGDTATLFRRREGWSDVRDASTAPAPPWLRAPDRAFGFEHLGGLLYVQINKIGDDPGETFAQFAQRLHDEIAATKPEKVGLDLRLNRGGNGMLVRPLIRALVQSEEIDRPGHLFGIIGPATFSAAQMLTDELEAYTNTIFVGEPTGSKGNAFGDSRKIVLPHSGITVRVSVYYWQYWHPMDKRDATAPQLYAPLTFDSYRNNVDPAVRAVTAYTADSSPPSR